MTPMMPATARRDVLAATQMFASLSPPDLLALADLATERQVKRGATVIRRGDPDCSLLLLVHGRLRAGSVSVEGRELTMGMLEAGTVLGEIALLDGGPRSLDVTAMADSMLLVLDRAAFLPFLMARPALMMRVMVLLCDRLRRSSKAFEDVAFASLSARLAALLLSLAETHGVPGAEGVQIRLRMSQREMSTQVAATRERVNKQLRQWHDAGVLGLRDGQLVLRRPAALRALLSDEA